MSCPCCGCISLSKEYYLIWWKVLIVGAIALVFHFGALGIIFCFDKHYTCNRCKYRFSVKGNF